MKSSKLGKELGEAFSEVLESMADVKPEELRARVQQISSRFEELLKEVAIRRESMLKVPPVSCTEQDEKELLDSFSALVNDLGRSDEDEGGIQKIVDRFAEMMWQKNPGENLASDADNPWKLEDYVKMNKEDLHSSFEDLLENITLIDPEQMKQCMQWIVLRFVELLSEATRLREATPDVCANLSLPTVAPKAARKLIRKFKDLLEDMDYHCPIEGERRMQKIARKYTDMVWKWNRLRDMSKQSYDEDDYRR